MENFDKGKILLAEDDVSMRRLLEIILQKEGYETVAVEDGLAAMQAAYDGDFDAVVADAVMPHLTGYDLCRILRDKSDVPIIILSGLDQPAEAENCLADVFLTKSARIKEDLLAALEKLLGTG